MTVVEFLLSVVIVVVIASGLMLAGGLMTIEKKVDEVLKLLKGRE